VRWIANAERLLAAHTERIGGVGARRQRVARERHEQRLRHRCGRDTQHTTVQIDKRADGVQRRVRLECEGAAGVICKQPLRTKKKKTKTKNNKTTKNKRNKKKQKTKKQNNNKRRRRTDELVSEKRDKRERHDAYTPLDRNTGPVLARAASACQATRALRRTT
jgi:hypothetical protein